MFYRENLLWLRDELIFFTIKHHGFFYTNVSHREYACPVALMILVFRSSSKHRVGNITTRVAVTVLYRSL